MPKKVVVPGKTLNEISKILSGDTDKEVHIFFTDKHIVFEFDNTTVVSRLIEGEYFKIDQMLSSDYETRVRISKKELLSSIDRATLLVKEGDKKPVIINITDGVMELKINSTVGSMNEDISIEEYAQSRGLSVSWFLRNFKQMTMKSPMQYILAIRINNAVSLLETTDYNVTEISTIVGYENPLYFSRIFKKQKGVSPSEYRKMLQGEAIASNPNE